MGNCFMRVSHDLLALVIAGTSLVLPAAGYAATLVGDVTIDTKPVRGALVTVFTADKMVSETVFTDAAGHYRLDTQFTGSLSLRARAPVAADSVAKVEVPSPNSKLTQRFSLRR